MTAKCTMSSEVRGMPRASKPMVGLHGGNMTGIPGPAVAVTRESSAAGSAWRWAKTP